MTIAVYSDIRDFGILVQVNDREGMLNVVPTIAELVAQVGTRARGIYLLDYTTKKNPGIPDEKLEMIQFVGLEGVQKPSFIPQKNWTNFSNESSFIQQFKELVLK